jgi:cyclohexanecarboxylate-CoA ligase
MHNNMRSKLRNSVRYDPALEQTFQKSGLWVDETLWSWLSRAVAEAGDRPALVMSERTISYREFADRVARVAQSLLRIGVEAGDVVAVQLPNIPEFMILYLALARIGAVLSTLHMPYRAEEIRPLLAHSQAKFFVGMSRFKDYSPVADMLRLRDSLPHLLGGIAVGEDVPGAIRYADLEDTEPISADHPEPSASEPFLLLFTSGTTASPKAVPLAYQVTLGNSRAVVKELGFSKEDRILSAAPLTHLLALYGVHLALECGAATILLPTFTPPELAAKIAESRPSVLLSAPAHMTNMAHLGLLDSTDLSSLRLVISSGAPCPPGLIELMISHMGGGHFVQQWGMTELQAGTFTRPFDPPEIATTTAGRACPGIEIRITDAEGTTLPPDVEGELQVRGSPVFREYLCNDEVNRESFTADGWFRTGDLASLDAQGNLRISGRTKNIINRGGVKYNPTDIEMLILKHADVADAAIIAFPDPLLGEKACCFIVPKGNRTPSLETLCAYLIAHGVSKPKLPERLEVIDEMPMTPTRKVIKAKLRARLG